MGCWRGWLTSLGTPPAAMAGAVKRHPHLQSRSRYSYWAVFRNSTVCSILIALSACHSGVTFESLRHSQQSSGIRIGQSAFSAGLALGSTRARASAKERDRECACACEKSERVRARARKRERKEREQAREREREHDRVVHVIVSWHSRMCALSRFPSRPLALAPSLSISLWVIEGGRCGMV